MRYLISIAVGPVQGFIAAARKTRDLYAGSWILSEVAKSAAAKLLEVQAEMIFPSAEKADLAAGSPFRAVNKVLAMVETGDPMALARDVEKRARESLLDMAASIGNPALTYDTGLINAHLKRSLEFYAAWVPYHGIEQYRQDREQVEILLESRKTVNAFSQHSGGEGLPKSSLDGALETVITSRRDQPRDLLILREGEELDGTGLLKRLVHVPGDEARFESTIEVAGMPYEQKVRRFARKSDQLKDAVERLRNFAADSHLPPDRAELLYEHESREIFKKDDPRASQLRELRKPIYALCGRPDAPYFALIAADGDSMGRRISELDLREHKDLSHRLSAFAAGVRPKLIELDCMPVFAGGDDVRAAAPLHRLLAAAEEIQRSFSEMVQAGKARFTISAGIAIVHALDPLDEGMRAAQLAEKHAKEVDGKDAVCFSVVPRTGAAISVAGPWATLMPLIKEIDAAYRRKALSFGFAHELWDLLGRTPPDLDEILPDLACSIAKNKKKEDSAAPDLVEKACRRGDEKYREGLEQLMKCMLVTRKLSKAYRDAFGGPEDRP